MLQITIIIMLAAAFLTIINVRQSKEIKKRIDDIDDGISQIIRTIDTASNQINNTASDISKNVDHIITTLNEIKTEQSKTLAEILESSKLSYDLLSRTGKILQVKISDGFVFEKKHHKEHLEKLEAVKQVLETYEEVLAIQKQNIEDYRAKMADKAVEDAENLAFAQRMYATIKERRAAGESLAHIAKSLDGNQYKTRDLAMLLANGDAMNWPTTIEDLVPGMKEDGENQNS